MGSTVRVRIRDAVFREYREQQIKALEAAARAAYEDLKDSGTMPYDKGDLQDGFTYLDITRKAEGRVDLVSDRPYAARLYFHPEYHYQTGHNPDAGGRWFETYITGEKRDMMREYYADELRKWKGGGDD